MSQDGRDVFVMHRSTTRQQNTNLKRIRGLIACAECRRLKLKCDKQIPCSHCNRRGCPTICPHGSLAAGYGSRFILSDRDKLERKLIDTQARIKALEDILRISHACHSSSVHPLLSVDLLSVKEGIYETVIDSEPEDALQTDEEDALDLFGTLTISNESTERFLGVTGTTESLLLRMEDPSSIPTNIENPRDAPSGTRNLIGRGNEVIAAFHQERKRDEELVLRTLKSRLPTYERATSLCEAYLENLSLFLRPVYRDQIYEELLPMLYDRMQPPQEASDYHKLALLFAVFACGAAGDLTLQPYNDEAATYHQFAISALALNPIIDGENVSLATVQAMSLLAVFHLLSGHKNSSERAWKVKCAACILATSIGLHRDPENWGLDPKETQRRRMAFWELYCNDHWQSLATGRPASLQPSTIDCKLPSDCESPPHTTSNGPTDPWAWKHRFVKEIASVLTAKLCSATSMKYSEVLVMDRKIRDFEAENRLQDDGHQFKNLKSFGAPAVLRAAPQMSDTLRQIVTGLFKEFALQQIHRGFFAKAIERNPTDPLQTSFAPSFIAAYRSSVTLLQTLRIRFDEVSSLLFRLWPLWSHAVTATVIVATVVARCPSISLAPSALIELNLAINLFEKAVVHPMVRRSLPVLLRMRNNARNAYFQYRSQPSGAKGWVLSKGTAYGMEDIPDDSEDTLSILRGRSRYVSTSKLPRTQSLHAAPRTSRKASDHHVAGDIGTMDSSARRQAFLSMDDSFINSSAYNTFPPSYKETNGGPITGTFDNFDIAYGTSGRIVQLIRPNTSLQPSAFTQQDPGIQNAEVHRLREERDSYSISNANDAWASFMMDTGLVGDWGMDL